MSVYTAVFVPVSVQQGRQVCDRFGKVFQMEGDILNQAGRPLLAQTAHLREDAGAKGPVGRALGLVFRKPDLGAEGLQGLRDGCNLVFQLRPCPGLGLGQHRRQLGQVRTQMRVVHRGKRTDIQHFCGRNQVPGHGHDRPGRRGQIREINHGRRLVGGDRQGLHRHFREEGQGPFRPHQEVGDDIERIRIGYQGQKIQPRHVLDRILIGNPFTQGRIGQHFVAKGFYRPQKIRMGGAEGRPAFLAAGIQNGSISQNHACAQQQTVTVETGSAAHARGIVGHDAAHHATADRGGIRAEPTLVPGQYPVDARSHQTRLKGNAFILGMEGPLFPVFSGHQQHAVGEGLARQTGARRPESNGTPLGETPPEHLRNLLLRLAPDHFLRHHVIETGIGSPRQAHQFIGINLSLFHILTNIRIFFAGFHRFA